MQQFNCRAPLFVGARAAEGGGDERAVRRGANDRAAAGAGCCRNFPAHLLPRALTSQVLYKRYLQSSTVPFRAFCTAAPNRSHVHYSHIRLAHNSRPYRTVPYCTVLYRSIRARTRTRQAEARDSRATEHSPRRASQTSRMR